MATYRKPLYDNEGNIIIPAMTSDQTGWVETDDIADGAIDSSKLNIDTARRFVHNTAYNGVPIPSNANLNSPTYCSVNHYNCPQTATVITLTNCPATTAFWMDVYTRDTVLDVTSSSVNLYLIRRITDISGNEWIQYVRSSSSANFTYSSWKRIKSGTSPNLAFYETPDTSTTYTPSTDIFSGDITIPEDGKILATASICGKVDTTTNSPCYMQLRIDDNIPGSVIVTNIATDHFASGSRIFDITKGTHTIKLRIASGNPNFTLKAYCIKSLTVVQI